MYVCLTFDRTVVDPSGECFMMPAPSLLADPSKPSAMYGFSAIASTCVKSEGLTEILTRKLQRTMFLNTPWHTYP